MYCVLYASAESSNFTLYEHVCAEVVAGANIERIFSFVVSFTCRVASVIWAHLRKMLLPECFGERFYVIYEKWVNACYYITFFPQHKKVGGTIVIVDMHNNKKK